MLGIGGTPEGIIAACALKCLGGTIQGKLAPHDEAERRKALEAGHDLNRVLTTDDLVPDDVFFAATGITDGELMEGVRYRHAAATTHSLVMRSRVRNHPEHPERAPAVETSGLQLHRLQLSGRDSHHGAQSGQALYETRRAVLPVRIDRPSRTSRNRGPPDRPKGSRRRAGTGPVRAYPTDPLPLRGPRRDHPR